MNPPRPPCTPAGGFNLVEVVVALGIFSVAILMVVGLMSPVSRMRSEILDGNTASRLSSAINVKLASIGYDGLVKGTKSTNNVPLLNSSGLDLSAPLLDKVLYANKSGDKIGVATDTIWNNSNNEKYYEILLIVNSTAVDLPALNGTREMPGAAVFIVRVTWPAYLPNADDAGQRDPTPRLTRSLFQYNYALPR